MKHLLLLVLVVGLARAEYTWTGTEWKWQNPEDTAPAPNLGGGVSGGVEGSGDSSPFGDDDDEYDEEEDYDYGDEYDEDEDYNKKQPKDNKGKGRDSTFNQGSASPDQTFYQPRQPTTFDLPREKTPAKSNPFNDFEGSGGAGISDDEDDEDFGDDDDIEGSGNFGRNPSWEDSVVTNPPRRVDQPKTDPPRWQEPPRQEVPKVAAPERDETLWVDNTNSGAKEEVFFGNDKDMYNPPVVVTTTESTRRAYEPKPTESPGVHKEGPTLHRPVSFFAQPGILAAVIGGAVVGLLCAILLVMFIVYRMRKKDEGSYALDEPKRAHNPNSYSKPPSREFYA